MGRLMKSTIVLCWTRRVLDGGRRAIIGRRSGINFSIKQSAVLSVVPRKRVQHLLQCVDNMSKKAGPIRLR